MTSHPCDPPHLTRAEADCFPELVQAVMTMSLDTVWSMMAVATSVRVKLLLRACARIL